MRTIKVLSACEIESVSKEKIEKFFRSKCSDEIRFVYEIDKSLIGGILAIDGEHYYDASVKGQLALIKRNFD